MDDLTLRLVQGRDWVEVAPFGSDVGEVVGGTVFVPGDWVRHPPGLPWKRSALAAVGKETLAGPFDLTLVSFAATRQNLAQAFVATLSEEDVPPLSTNPAAAA